MSQSADSVACQVGKTLEKRKGECGYYQLWRRGEKSMACLLLSHYNATKWETQMCSQLWHLFLFKILFQFCDALFACVLLFLQEVNTEKLTAFINTLNGKEGTGSHLVTVPPGPSLADALLSSPILAGEGGSMMGLGASDFEFGVDPSADPELALVSKRVS